jgi:hypothetical protein
MSHYDFTYPSPRKSRLESNCSARLRDRRNAQLFGLARVSPSVIVLDSLNCTCRFCSQVFRRGGMQLRPWELDQSPDEEKGSWSQGTEFLSGHNSPESQKRQNVNAYSLQNDICSFSADSKCLPMSQSIENPSSTVTSPPADPSNLEKLPSVNAGDVHPRPGESATRVKREFKRPPIFGPERVVLDPRIRAVHKQIVIDMYRFGGLCTVVSSSFSRCV